MKTVSLTIVVPICRTIKSEIFYSNLICVHKDVIAYRTYRQVRFLSVIILISSIVRSLSRKWLLRVDRFAQF